MELISRSFTALPAPPMHEPFLNVDDLIDRHVDDALSAFKDGADLLPGMIRYHLGLVDRDLKPVQPETVDRGKRMRPGVALLSCSAAGGTVENAAPLAAAIELLHNFTLIHDDIQDRSPSRRHRPTVWSVWGEGQAINAGDALFAVAQLALLHLSDLGQTAEQTLKLAGAFNRVTVEIVSGQVLDLVFEGRDDVTPADYLEMIAAKTAAIVRFAAWGGAVLAGASAEAASAFGDFGLALGLGFQIQDDLLGIWGASSTTGKASADDIRRRKQSLPILLLRDRVDRRTRGELNQLYQQTEIEPSGVRRVLELLNEHEVRLTVEEEVRLSHDRARHALFAATGNGHNPARDTLLALVETLAGRQS